MKSFSLLTLLLLVLIAALVASHIAMMGQLADARAEAKDAREEISDVRRKFGYIEVEDPRQTYVSWIPDTRLGLSAFRIQIPPGQHYMLHLTDTDFPADEYPLNPVPTKTLSMNSWKQGADVILNYSIGYEDGVPHVRVSTGEGLLFDYRMDGLTKGAGMRSSHHLQTDPQSAFSVDDTVRFMWWRDEDSQRGVMLWMEPVAAWHARNSSNGNRN